MAYNILGVNPGHNGSVALISDGELLYYIEEERLSRQKYDGNPFRGILDVLSKWHVDEIVIAGTSPEYVKLPWTGENPYTALVRKFNPKVKTTVMGDEHHLGHAGCAFYNSGFKEAAVIVVDGAGSFKSSPIIDNHKAEGFEAESIWLCSYPFNFTLVNRFLGNNQPSPGYFNGVDYYEDSVTITKAYEAVSQYLGFGFIEAGKTMGLAPYGSADENIPNLFVGKRGSKDVFIPSYPAGAYVDTFKNSYLAQKQNPDLWHRDPTQLTSVEKNLAWKIQQDTQRLVGDLIQQAVDSTGQTNIVIVGGYGLNCVANYYFKKRFPALNIYNEAISHDGGTSIGVAKIVHHMNTRDESIRPQTTLYHGPKYDSQLITEALAANSDKITVSNVSYQDVAKLISERNIISLFQGGSEAGPRALGNRSIVYDPRDPDGKDFVNKVKGREWFRPFAGSVLAEDANDWFDMAGMDESPFMMCAVNVAADKLSVIPCVTHVDDTCRVQTVKEEQNVHYYNLIKAFKDITNVPVLFNTSFNLAGDPLVETIDNAFDTLFRSKMKYLYLPELGVLVTKTIEDPEQ